MGTSTTLKEHRGFTLTEMLVVITIIVIVIGISIPALNVWESRKREEAINLMRGLLYSAQLKAAGAEDGDSRYGLFFFVDPDTRRQKVWPIEQDYDSGDWVNTQFRYVLRDKQPVILPSTMRVLPLSVLAPSGGSQFTWTVGQLNSEELRDPADDGSDCSTPSNRVGSVPSAAVTYGEDTGHPVDPGWATQFQRNFFVVLFDASGQVVTIKQRALIVDPRPEFYEPKPASPSPGVIGFHTRQAVLDEPDSTFHNAIIHSGDESELAYNPIYFASTSGVIVYDDEEFQNLAEGDDPCAFEDPRVEYLRRDGQALYIHGTTGQIIKGETPKGD